MRSRPVIDLDTISIRAADTGDLPGVLALYAQPDFDDGHALPIDEAERLFAYFSRYPDYTLYVAEQAGRIVGSFALLIMDNLGHLGAPSAIIEDLVVDPALQGHGVGQAIMNLAVARARGKRCYKILLSSNAKRERAHAFYERLGFERHGYSFRLMLEQVPA
jgi:GNAT superfamily N-acetyltransferase